MIRKIVDSDLPELRRIHSQSGAGYDFQDLSSLLFINLLVSTENGSIVGAGLHKVCYETFLLVDPSRRPQEKWNAIAEINDRLLAEAYWQGLDEIHASVPPIGFDRRLLQLGWSPDRPDWRLWSRRTHALSNDGGRERSNHSG